MLLDTNITLDCISEKISLKELEKKTIYKSIYLYNNETTRPKLCNYITKYYFKYLLLKILLNIKVSIGLFSVKHNKSEGLVYCPLSYLYE